MGLIKNLFNVFDFIWHLILFAVGITFIKISERLDKQEEDQEEEIYFDKQKNRNGF